ncbi:hypothetical protein HYH03_010168 [Edaphochlamys debaryana]|uniref:Uncharacterized protein n=1 Tax=Edaphochlamys debaryana TaxID=47281 RepID=A0A835XYZ6_9CHLO|nr:hypothetical protein HYH03_010168 [Edaphochlamys debaryana]|eukprot:KAG2491603.1 hypothetical protein HYH03_010168 [Edaphochlamys debaryana]
MGGAPVAAGTHEGAAASPALGEAPRSRLAARAGPGPAAPAVPLSPTAAVGAADVEAPADSGRGSSASSAGPGSPRFAPGSYAAHEVVGQGPQGAAAADSVAAAPQPRPGPGPAASIAAAGCTSVRVSRTEEAGRSNRPWRGWKRLTADGG